MLLFSKFPSGVLLGVACMSSTHAERTEQYNIVVYDRDEVVSAAATSAVVWSVGFVALRTREHPESTNLRQG